MPRATAWMVPLGAALAAWSGPGGWFDGAAAWVVAALLLAASVAVRQVAVAAPFPAASAPSWLGICPSRPRAGRPAVTGRAGCAAAASAADRARATLLMLLLVGGFAPVATTLDRGHLARVPPGTELDVTVSGEAVRVERDDGRISRVELRFDGCVPGCVQRRVQLGLYAPLPIAEGERWQLPVRLRPPRAAANPGRGDPELRHWRRGIDGVGYVREPAAARRLAPAPAPDALQRLRTALAARIDAASADGGALLRALLLGDRDGLHARDWQRLAASGTTHLFVVSGLHVGLVAGAVLLLLRLGGIAMTSGAAALLVLACAACYALLTGFGIPARRALLMLAVVLLTSVLGRTGSGWSALGWAASLILLLDPLAVLDFGFWLSVIAVLALIVMTIRRASGPLPLPVRALLLVRTQLLVTGILAFPLVLAFGWFPATSPVVNLIAIPLVALLVLPAGLLALLLSSFGVEAAETVLAVLGAGLAGMLELSDAGARPLTLAPLSGTLAVLGLAAAWVAAWPGPRLVRLPALAVALIAIGAPPTRPALGEFRVHVFDVGQGLSVLVRTRHHQLLYDTGDRFDRSRTDAAPDTTPDTTPDRGSNSGLHDDRRNASPGGSNAGSLLIAPALRALGVAHIDRLLVSHADSDHAGGVPGILAALPVLDFRGPASLVGTNGVCAAGLAWQWDGVRFDVLYPQLGPTAAGRAAGESNRSSCVLRIRSREGAVLLPGDVDHWAERRFAARVGPIDLLLAPHHGSRTSSDRSLVRHARPRWVVFPAGATNAFGHPHPDVVQRWEDAGACVATTGVHGMLSWSSSAPERLRAWRADRDGWWRWRAVSAPLPRRCLRDRPGAPGAPEWMDGSALVRGSRAAPDATAAEGP